ncbi:8-oxoguanine glycosylase ogg1 [Entomophthora muscae]|uniref:8-oxoguanine glycosylase ogg1 n=1 Tax=Entomophthora muscae TaxID=34485 RepID=A0ACC2UJ90_9FUNG|nr:8-oxoguanine glycosylase ogg1 [Entomophthora muscae]
METSLASNKKMTAFSFSAHPKGSLTNLDLVTEQLKDYFQLDLLCLEENYKRWSDADPHFKTKAIKIPGVRILRQDPLENIISFICSSNNNISRISQMVQNLCKTYGACVGSYKSQKFYSFPALEDLANDGVEAKLRELGFGYRAKYISRSSRQILSLGGKEWLNSLRKAPFLEARQAIQKLSGVGPKVADCVCLMSLDKSEAIPVDTHVFQIAVRDYKIFEEQGRYPQVLKEISNVKKKLKISEEKDSSTIKLPKTLTPAIYLKISVGFRQLFGAHAGWAHSVSSE